MNNKALKETAITILKKRFKQTCEDVTKTDIDNFSLRQMECTFEFLNDYRDNIHNIQKIDNKDDIIKYVAEAITGKADIEGLAIARQHFKDEDYNGDLSVED